MIMGTFGIWLRKIRLALSLHLVFVLVTSNSTIIVSTDNPAGHRVV